MATYYHTSSNQRDSAPMLYLREPLSNSYPESPPVLPNNNVMMYTPNYASPSMDENSEQQNNCVDITSMGASISAAPHQEILSNLGGDFNGWRDSRNEMVFMNPIASSSQNMLSLSLGTQILPTGPTGGLQMPPSVQFRNPNSAFSSFLSPHIATDDENFHGGNQNPTRVDPCVYGVPNIGRDVSNSKYLKAAQKLLDEVVHVWKAALKSGDSEKKTGNDGGEKEGSTLSPAVEHPQGECAENSHHEISASDRQELHNKLSKLLTMLDEVDRQYKQYYHQMQIVVLSFDSIAGYGASKPYTALALQTISRHFRCLRDAITAQIRTARRNLGEPEVCTNGGKGVGISRLRYVDQQLRQHRALHQLGMMQQHTWRPQRGLPETSVTYLRAWLFEHFLHPYPKDSDKTMLARQTGLTRSQVSNWFINARVRLWKPMVEEMYKEETGEGGTMDSNSSSENASKEATMAEQQSTTATTSAATDRCGGGQLLPNRNPISEPESQYGAVMKFRPDMEECGIYENAIVPASYGMDGLTGFGNGGGVSLTLGLQHCDMHMNMRGDEDDGVDDMYTSGVEETGPGAGPVIGLGSGDFDCLDNGEGEQQRFHLLHDFVDYGGKISHV